MTQQIVLLYARLEARRQIERQVAEHVAFSQHETFFQLATLKGRRIRHLRSRFEDKPVRKIFVSSNLGSIGYSRAGTEVKVLPKNFFQVADTADLARKAAELEGALVIVNNNDVYGPPAPANTDFSDFYVRCENTAFLAWDWDNHHWMQRTTFLAVHSDLYFPAHNENMYLLSRLNWLLCGPMACATVQWSREFLSGHFALMAETPRRDDPLGMHFFYPAFGFRNQTVVTLHQSFEHIGFSTPAFHQRTEVDRLTEWCTHKSHWVIPVLNDIPLRLFDALATGGIPIVPQSLAFLEPVRQIPRSDIVFYTAEDIVDPTRVADRARRLFDEGGAAGVARRARHALDFHHGVNRLGAMIRCAQEVLGFTA